MARLIQRNPESLNADTVSEAKARHDYWNAAVGEFAVDLADKLRRGEPLCEAQAEAAERWRMVTGREAVRGPRKRRRRPPPASLERTGEAATYSLQQSAAFRGGAGANGSGISPGHARLSGSASAEGGAGPSRSNR